MMADRSAIEWTDATWNPLVGCSRVSEGCQHCYAERHAYRFSGGPGVYEGTARLVNGHPTFTGRVNFNARVLDLPLRWKRPRRIFVNSMSDLFHEKVSDNIIAAVFAAMAAAPQHTFQVLTKRPARALHWFEWMRESTTAKLHECLKAAMGYHHPRRTAINDGPWPLPNVWLGVSVENQFAADGRIPLLLQTPAAVRFLSCEPLLGLLDLTAIPGPIGVGLHSYDALRGRNIHHDDNDRWTAIEKIDWVIAGGESGPGARPMHPDWARSLRDQCAAAGVPFFLKQWGEWVSVSEVEGPGAHHAFPDGATVRRVGKKRAGHLLDGIEHHAFPELRT